MESKEVIGLIQRYVNAYNSFDVEGMLQLLHNDIKFRNISNGEVDVETKGIEEFRKIAVQSKKIFSQREQTIISHSITNDGAEVDIHFRGY